MASWDELDPPLSSSQLHPLIQIKSLLTLKIQDGDSPNAELKVLRAGIHKVMGDAMVASPIFHTVYGVYKFK